MNKMTVCHYVCGVVVLLIIGSILFPCATPRVGNPTSEQSSGNTTINKPLLQHNSYPEPESSPTDLETLADISIIAKNKPPFNPSEPNPPPSGNGEPWKPSDKGSDIVITLTTKDANTVLNNSTHAGVWIKLVYTMWDGTSGYYKVQMWAIGNTARAILGGTPATNFIVVGGTHVRWFINASCDQWTPKAHLSACYDYSVGGVWTSHDFASNIYFNISTQKPIVGEPVQVTLTTKSLSHTLIREAVLSVDITYPDGSKDRIDTKMLSDGNDSSGGNYIIPLEYNMKAGTLVKLSAIVYAYAGYGYYYGISSMEGATHYNVSYSGIFPKDASFNAVCTISADPDIYVSHQVKSFTPVNITIKSKPDFMGNPVSIFPQIFYYINVTNKPPLFGIEVMNEYSRTQGWYILPGIDPSLSDTKVEFWIKATDLEGKTVTSAHCTYLVPPIPLNISKFALVLVQAIDDLIKVGIVNAPVEIIGLDYSLSSKTGSNGVLVPHEPGRPSVIHFFPIGKTYVFNLTYPELGQSLQIEYVIDAHPKSNTFSIAGRNHDGDRKSNWSIVLEIDQNGLRTLRFIFNCYSPTILVFAEVVAFPDSFIEYITYTTAIILLIPIVMVLDKRRKSREEDEKRVTL